MSRPLMQHGVGQLEEMFAKAKTDPKVLKQLVHELQHRQVPRAIALLADVQAAMPGGTRAAPAVAATAQQLAREPVSVPEQSSLWERAVERPVAATTPVAASRPTVPTVRPPVAKPHAPPLLAVLIEDACKVLKTTPGATWESIEYTRRQLVQQSHPSLLKQLNDERRAQALADARHANAAYFSLQTVRCSRT